MPKVIESRNDGVTIGHVMLGERGGVTGSVRQEVHDGDTIIVRGIGNLSIRFLGIDTPEISFQLPGSNSFSGTGSAAWDAFLADPLSNAHGAINLRQELHDDLAARAQAGAAINHRGHAEAAEDKLEELILADLVTLGIDEAALRFYLVFTREVTDGYGRLLAFINADFAQPPRPPSYNQRLLESGFASPYFIWPNIDPWRSAGPVEAAVPAPHHAHDDASAGALGTARQAVKDARANATGIFTAGNELIFDAFELRYLARRRAPYRWVVDLSQATAELLHPERYIEIPNAEDRLWVPPEYVPLWVEQGWIRSP